MKSMADKFVLVPQAEYQKVTQSQSAKDNRLPPPGIPINDELVKNAEIKRVDVGGHSGGDLVYVNAERVKQQGNLDSDTDEDSASEESWEKVWQRV